MVLAWAGGLAIVCFVPDVGKLLWEIASESPAKEFGGFEGRHGLRRWRFWGEDVMLLGTADGFGYWSFEVCRVDEEDKIRKKNTAI